MSGKPADEQGIDRAATELWDFSPSRLGVASRCGLAFEYQYIRKIPAAQENARAMFGNAIHDGTQAWYELPDEGPAMGFQVHDLAPIVLAQWERLLPPVIWQNVLELRTLEEELAAIEAAILFKRPEIKAPRQTKEFLSADAVKEFADKRNAMNERADKLQEVRWPRDEDPYKAYQVSAKIAAEMQARWQGLPRPLVVEFPFRIEVFGFAVRGRIDQLRVDPKPGTGEAIPRMVDIKTSIQVMTPMEAFLQSFIYNEAIELTEHLPSVNGDIAFYLARKNAYQQGRIDRERHGRIASRIINGKARQIIMGQFEPNYGHWCKQCDFRDLCESELSMWQGDGLVVELM